ncbi:MAG TPA: NAD(+) synthase [Cyclobacteriaceae bacterium]|nr:NAD(+) synthase [Cyclobacteriaceae bacterium]
MSNVLTIGGATLNQTPIDWNHNTANIIAAIEAAKEKQTNILCLPELCITGYGCEDLFLSDWVSEKAWVELEKIIPRCNNITVCVGLPIRIEDITYNGCCVIQDGKILGVTLKQNLARDGIHYEPRWFDAWTPHRVVNITRNGKDIKVGDLIYKIGTISFALEICEDAWRKIRPAKHLAEQGVQLILNPSASHFALGKSNVREKLVMDSSSMFNCVYAYVNLLGNESGRIIYDGDILIARHGKLLLQNKRLSFQSFNLQVSQVDFDATSSQAAIPIDDKEKNEEFARAESLALFDYLRKSKAKGFVLSLSGGADSSTCATLVAEMVRRGSKELGWATFCSTLGIKKTESEKEAVSQLLTTAYQGTKNSSDSTFQAAQSLAQSIGAQFYHWLIDEEVNSYRSKIEDALGRPLTWDQDDIALQNIQARGRSPIIWLLANVKQSVLLTTSNRSEGDVGYATMDGDTSGSLAPIAGIDKPFLLQWLKWAEMEKGYLGLHQVNNLQPTAELRPRERAQTDEKDLMPYTILVEIEKLAIQERKPPVEVYKTLLDRNLASEPELKKHVHKFFTLWSINQWKRERIAPSFHLDDFNVDPRSWCRFPILSGSFKAELEELKNLQ